MERAVQGLPPKAWMEARRVLTSNGVFVLNIKDHIRGGEVIPVSRWHVDTLFQMGFMLRDQKMVYVPSQKFGQNGEKRVPYENVFMLTVEQTEGYAIIWLDNDAAFLMVENQLIIDHKADGCLCGRIEFAKTAPAHKKTIDRLLLPTESVAVVGSKATYEFNYKEVVEDDKKVTLHLEKGTECKPQRP